MLRWVAAVSVFSGVGTAFAEPVRMTGDDIKRVMQPGAVLEIDTPLRTSIPVTVAPNGMVSGDAGALGLTLGALKDRGRWWTEGDQLCMKWFRWFDARKRCISLQRTGNKVWWYEDSGESGTATITEVQTAPTVTVAAAPPRKPQQRTQRDAIDDRAAPADVPIAQEDNSPARQFAAAAISEASEPPPVRKPQPEQMNVGAPPPPAAAPKVRDAAPLPRRQAKASPAPQRAASQNTAKTKRVAAAQATAISTSTVALVSFRVSRVEEGDELNVRSGPSEYHPMVGSIPARGRGVQIVGACQDLWCPIRHGRLTGWVNRYYLAEDVVQQTSAKR